jgi:hypothetical protein
MSPSRRYLSDVRTDVLVEREMENWRSPLASIPRASWENIARRKWRLVNWAAAETATGFKKGKTRWVAGAHTARVGGRNKLARKKTVTARTLILPAKRLSPWPLSEMVYRPECRICSTSGCPTILAQVEVRVFSYFLNPAAQFWTSVIGSLDF